MKSVWNDFWKVKGVSGESRVFGGVHRCFEEGGGCLGGGQGCLKGLENSLRFFEKCQSLKMFRKHCLTDG